MFVRSDSISGELNILFLRRRNRVQICIVVQSTAPARRFVVRAPQIVGSMSHAVGNVITSHC